MRLTFLSSFFASLFCLPILAQITPELPNTSSVETCFPDTAGYQILTVGPVGKDYSDLQIAINAAKPGSILLLDAGYTFKGSFNLPEKAGEGWIIITSSKMNLLPEQGNRIQPYQATGDPVYPEQRDAMPKIITNNLSGLPCFRTIGPAHHYRLVGLEIAADPAVLNSYGLLFLGDSGSAQNTYSSVPHDMIVDRCYIHGHTNAAIMKAGVLLNCANSAVIESHISDFHSIGYDTYTIGGTNGPGPFIIRNNYLEAAGENILFGGAAPVIKDLVPSDIEIKNNYFYKPFSWRVGHPDYAGKHWTIKNLFELKTGKRVLVEGNLFENSWADLPTGQSGYAILLTVRSEGGASPQADVSDITIKNNIIRHAGAGISLSGKDSPPAQQSTRIEISNNLFDDINGEAFGDGNIAGPNDGVFIKIGEPDNVNISHNTVFQTGAITWAYDTVKNIFIRDNIFNCFLSAGGYQGIYGPGFAQGGNGPMGAYFPGVSDSGKQFHKNVLTGGNASKYNKYTTISQNYFPGTHTEVGFIDFNSGMTDFHKYALDGNSPYIVASTDGVAIGVDFNKLDEAFIISSPCKTTGLNTGQVEIEIKIFPNPFWQILSFQASRSLTDAEFYLLNSTGAEVFRCDNIFGDRFNFEVDYLPEGVYFCQLYQKGIRLFGGKVIK